MFPLWFSNSNSKSFCNAGIQALTRPHQLEHVSSPFPSAVRIFVSFDLTSRKSYCFYFSTYFPDVTPTEIFSTGQTMTGLATTTPVGTCSDYLTVAGSIICSGQQYISFTFDQRFGVKWTFLLKRSNHILPWISTTPGQTGTDPPSICGTNTGYHSELKSIEQYSKQYQHSNLHYLISVCWIWRKLDGLDKSDVHVRVDHLCQDLECPASSDFLHGFL